MTKWYFETKRIFKIFLSLKVSCITLEFVHLLNKHFCQVCKLVFVSARFKSISYLWKDAHSWSRYDLHKQTYSAQATYLGSSVPQKGVRPSCLVLFRRNVISILEEVKVITVYSDEQTSTFEQADSTISGTVQIINSHLKSRWSTNVKQWWSR